MIIDKTLLLFAFEAVLLVAQIHSMLRSLMDGELVMQGPSVRQLTEGPRLNTRVQYLSQWG